MHPLIEQLLAAAPVVTDGAWGTELQQRGLAVGECPDAWNLSHPDRVEEVACAYVAAGSRVLLTNTFRANGVALAGHNLADRVEAINAAGAEISCRAAGDAARVFGSLGPSGKMLMTGDVQREELQTEFSRQAEALAAGGVDALVVETMADLEEAKIALAAAKRTGLPVVVCMVFDTGKGQDRTMMGVTPEQAAEELTASGTDVIGANCGQGIATYIQICQRLRAATDRPLWIKPNAGVPEVVGDSVAYRTTASEFAEQVPALVAAGADFVGGCCGTTPAFIEAVCRKAHA